MPKTDNPHAVRLYNSLARYADEETAQRIANGMPLSKSADFNKKFRWAEYVCAALEREFPDGQVKRIRMECACGPETGKIARLRKVYEASESLADFAERANRLQQGFTILYEEGALYLMYPRCYCSCVKRVEQSLPKSWCYCSLGYARRMFEAVLGREVRAELVESVKTGGKCCKIRICEACAAK